MARKDYQVPSALAEPKPKERRKPPTQKAPPDVKTILERGKR